MLTSLEPPFPASPTRPHEVDMTPPCSLPATPQLAGPLSIVSPPETSSPKRPLDTPDLSKGISPLERWLQARFRKTNKKQGLQPSDQPATMPGRPFNSQSQSTENTSKRGPPRMAAGQHVRVSVLIMFTGRQMVVVCLTSYLESGCKTRQLGSLSGLSIGAVVYSYLALQNKGSAKTTKASRRNKEATSNGQGSAGTKEAATVSPFPTTVVHIMNPDVLSGATRERTISAVGRPGGGSCHGGNSSF